MYLIYWTDLYRYNYNSPLLDIITAFYTRLGGSVGVSKFVARHA